MTPVSNFEWTYWFNKVVTLITTVEALRSRVEEIAGALEKLATCMASELTAIECPPTDEQSDWPLIHEAQAILTATPAEALERARTKDEVVKSARALIKDGIVEGSSDLNQIVGQYLGQALAKLDALSKQEGL